MASVTQQQPDNSTNRAANPVVDSSVLTVAREIYSSYCKTHTKNLQRPLGAVVRRDSHRGQLIFKSKPILLPRECFVPFREIETTELP